MTRTIVVTPPAPLMAPDLVRQRLGLTEQVADATLAAYIAAATAVFDCPGGWLGRAIGAQTLETQTDAFPGCHRHDDMARDDGSWHHRGRHDLTLPFSPITAIVSVSYVAEDGASVVLDPSTYLFDGQRTLTPALGTVWPITDHRRNGVRIRYAAGYAAVPDAIIHAVVLGVSSLVSLTRADILLKQDTVVGVSSMAFETSADVSAVIERSAAALLAPYRVFD